MHINCTKILTCFKVKLNFFTPCLPSGGMHCIQQHTFGLARYTYMLLSSLCHGNRRPVAQMYTQGQFESPHTQGAILNFNLVDSHGQIIGYSKVHCPNKMN